MTQVAARELDSRQGHRLGFVVVAAILPEEGDRTGIHPQHAGIGDGGAGDIGAEVFERAGARTGRLDMHSPVFAPDFRIDLPVVLLE